MSSSELSTGTRILRKAVIMMGYVLVMGTLALFVAIYFKYSHKKAAPTSSVAMQFNDYSEKCAFKTNADIDVGDKIINSNVNGNILTLITANKIIIFDLCKGTIISSLNIVGTN